MLSFFLFFDLYKPRTGPLSHFTEQRPSTIDSEIARQQCTVIVQSLNTKRQEDDLCHWTYTCNFDLNRFPTTIINATTCTAAPGAACIQRIHSMTTFSRTFDEHNVPRWIKDNTKVDVHIGYTCRRTR